MKKIFAVLLILVMILSLAACGQKAEPVAVEEKPAEAEPAVEPAEEPAAEPAEEPAPEEPAREIQEIEITGENFDDYFEFVTVADYDNAEKDAEGNITSLTVYYDYVLREGFEAAVEKAADCELAADFDIEYVDCLNPYELDFENLSHDSAEVETPQSFAASCSAGWWDGKVLCDESTGYDGAEFKMTLLEFNFGTENIQELVSAELVSASGTIYLYAVG